VTENEFDNNNSYIPNQQDPQSEQWSTMQTDFPPQNNSNNDNDRLKKIASNALYNGIFGIVFSAWTVLAIFGLQWTDTLWVILFVGVDFICSIPAIFNAVRSRQYNKTMFVASMAMGIISAITSLTVLIIWAI